MKSHLLTISFLFFALTVYGQQKVEKFMDNNFKQCDPSVARYYSISEKKDSVWHEKAYYLPEKTLEMDGYYVEGQRNGPFLFLYPDGKPKEQGLFIKNKREGIHLRFYENGMMQDSTKFLNGKVIGHAFSWFENGSPSAKMALDTVGNETGFAIRYFLNKNISDEGEFGKGMKKNGRWTYYHDNGIKSAVVNYDYNVVVSKICFDESGVEQPTCNLLVQKAEFPGGQENLEKYVLNHIVWPNIKFREKDGKIIIQVAFTIDRDGNVKDAKLVKSIQQ